MDLDLSALVGMSQAQARCEQQLQPSTPTVMHSLVMSSIPSVPPAHPSMLWGTPDDFNGYALGDVMGLEPDAGVNDASGRTEASAPSCDNSSVRDNCLTTTPATATATIGIPHSLNGARGNPTPHSTAHPSGASPHSDSLGRAQHTRPCGRKRRLGAGDENVESEVEVSKEEVDSCSVGTGGEKVYGDSGSNDAAASQLLGQLAPSVATDIDPHVVCQMGGLAFAELCKERAREQFKERKKNEHLANGKFHRLKRRKKNDTSMSDKEKYVRRLQMNQDSAAAARYAHEVYIQVLEKLVKMSEEERGSFSMEMQRVRAQNEHLQSKVQELQAKVDQLEAEESQEVYAESKYTDPALAKILELLKGPTSISVDYGVQPARAV